MYNVLYALNHSESVVLVIVECYFQTFEVKIIEKKAEIRKVEMSKFIICRRELCRSFICTYGINL